MSTTEKTNSEKKLQMTFFAGCIAVVAFFMALGWAGDVDYTEQIILRMSYDEYNTIKETLKHQQGHEPSEREIAHYWADHNR